MKMANDGKSATIKIDPPKRQAVEKIVVHLEHFERPVKTVRLANRELRDAAQEIRTDKSVVLRLKF
jgi:hypothetical protein